MSSLKRGRDMDNQAWYAVLRHRRGNPDTRFAVTYPYCCTLSTLPADGTLAPEGRPWVLKGGSRLSGRSGVIPLEIRFIESEGARVYPEAQLREWAFDKLVGGAGI